MIYMKLQDLHMSTLQMQLQMKITPKKILFVMA